MVEIQNVPWSGGDLVKVLESGTLRDSAHKISRKTQKKKYLHIFYKILKGTQYTRGGGAFIFNLNFLIEAKAKISIIICIVIIVKVK